MVNGHFVVLKIYFNSIVERELVEKEINPHYTTVVTELSLITINTSLTILDMNRDEIF